jgi:hypothetical protein
MRHLKAFESYESKDLGEEIAQDLLPRLEKMRAGGTKITPEYFDKYMEERGAESSLIDSVMSYLVNMGFDFDVDDEPEIDDINFSVKVKENLEYSGSDVTKMPIIGKIITRPIGPFDRHEYNVVEIIKDRNGLDIYVVDKWYKRRIPQIIHSELVEEYIPN